MGFETRLLAVYNVDSVVSNLADIACAEVAVDEAVFVRLWVVVIALRNDWSFAEDLASCAGLNIVVVFVDDPAASV